MTSLSLDPTRNKRRGTVLLSAIIMLALIVTAIGLAWNSTPTKTSSVVQGPETPQALWAAQEIDSYRYTLEVSCFCVQEMTRPVTIEVRDGQVAAITYADGSAADPALFERYDSIDGLFALIAEAETQDPARLDVTYAEETGVPLSVDIDISEQMADEELRFQVTGFEVLQ